MIVLLKELVTATAVNLDNTESAFYSFREFFYSLLNKASGIPSIRRINVKVLSTIGFKTFSSNLEIIIAIGIPMILIYNGSLTVQKQHNINNLIHPQQKNIVTQEKARIIAIIGLTSLF